MSVSKIASGSRFVSEERLSAQAISQLLQATHRPAFTKMDFMILPRWLSDLYPPDRVSSRMRAARVGLNTPQEQNRAM